MGAIVILHLGVVDIPYAGKTTTGDVAGFLEEKYNVMGTFASMHMPEIVEVVEISVTEAIDALMSGAPSTLDPFGSATQNIGSMFQNYIENEEIAQTGQSGVPTQAALDGVRTSLKKKKEIKGKAYRSRVRGTRRPSFDDTGLYRNSFRAWVD